MISVIIYIKLSVHVGESERNNNDYLVSHCAFYIMCYIIILYLDYCFSISVDVDALYFFTIILWTRYFSNLLTDKPTK